MRKINLLLCLWAVTATAASNETRRIDCVQVNQAGYLPQAFKVCLCENPPRPEFRVQRLDEETEKRCWHDVYTGTFRKLPDSSALYEGDFTAVTRPGDYRIVCGTKTAVSAYDLGRDFHGVVSAPFGVRTVLSVDAADSGGGPAPGPRRIRHAGRGLDAPVRPSFGDRKMKGSLRGRIDEQRFAVIQ